MKLSRQQRATLHSALLDAYRSYDELSQMLQFQIDVDLDITIGQGALTDVVFKLIKWAEARGRGRELVEGALRENPENIVLKQWVEQNQESLTNTDEATAAGGVSLMPDRPEGPWWEQIPNISNSIAGIDLGDTSGDVIIANVGSGAKNVAVGKNISQVVTESIGEPRADDAALINEQIQKVLGALNQAEVEPRTIGRAEVNIERLEEEFGKTADDDPPSAKTISQVGDWLLENVPEIAQALTELFGMPAVGRLLGKAGDAAVDWARKRFES